MGHIIYEGPSLIDGGPIIVIATDKTSNRKTGDMLQTWILRADMDPVSASRTGADHSICGDCVHRGQPSNRPTGQASGRSCYVTLALGPQAVWRSIKRGAYQPATDLIDLGRGKLVRIGTYGDGAAVPQQIWDQLCSEAKGWTAYTHQGNPDRDRFMTSVESEDQALAAWARGERTFRVVKSPDDIFPELETLCPASKEAGQRTTCAHCKLCAGATTRAKNVAIVAHGTGARNWA